MSCRKFGWRGHKFISGVCACGISKVQSQIESDKTRLERLVEEASSFSFFSRGRIASIILMFAGIFVFLTFIPKLVNSVFDAGCNSTAYYVNGTNTSPCAGFHIPFFIWMIIAPLFTYQVIRMFFSYNDY